MTTLVSTPPAADTTTVQPVDLTINAFCDADSGSDVQAYVFVAVTVDGEEKELRFCKHHFERSEPHLMTAGARVVLDIRDRLLEDDRLSGEDHA